MPKIDKNQFSFQIFSKKKQKTNFFNKSIAACLLFLYCICCSINNIAFTWKVIEVFKLLWRNFPNKAKDNNPIYIMLMCNFLLSIQFSCFKLRAKHTFDSAVNFPLESQSIRMCHFYYHLSCFSSKLVVIILCQTLSVNTKCSFQFLNCKFFDCINLNNNKTFVCKLKNRRKKKWEYNRSEWISSDQRNVLWLKFQLNVIIVTDWISYLYLLLASIYQKHFSLNDFPMLSHCLAIDFVSFFFVTAYD